MRVALATWWPLWLLLAVPWSAWLAWRAHRMLSRRRIAVAAALRALALALVALALASPTLDLPTRALSVVYALDVSQSMEPAFVQTALDWITQTNTRYHPAHAAYVAFAARAQSFASLPELRAAAVAPTMGRETPTAATDIERGIASAALAFLPDHAKRLVLISDGNQTRGDVWRTLPQLRSARVPVFALPAPSRFAAQAWVDAIELPGGVRQQQPVALHVRVSSSAALPAQLQLEVASEAVLNRRLELAHGDNDIALDVRFKRAGLTALKVKLMTPDGHLEQRAESVWVKPPLRVLYVDGGRIPSHELADALAVQGMEVDTMAAQQFVEGARGALAHADVVLLSDVPAERLDESASRALTAFVRDAGGGLILIAGENTYGKGGYAGSAVERLLPIKFEARRSRRDLDLVLLIDRSYSMRGPKLEFAKSAALATLDLLEEQHRLAVVAFDSLPHDVVPLAQVGAKRRAEDLISSMTSAGRTDIYNALWRARELLQSSRAKTKHVILVSDGETAPPPNGVPASKRAADAKGMLQMLHSMGYGHGAIDKLIGEDAPVHPAAASGGFEELVASMAAADITLSTVAIGDKPNLPLMAGLAQWGHGKSYVAQRDSEIPAVFVTEARRLLGESLIEEPFRPAVRARSEVLAGVDLASAPELKGFVAARPKRFSDVLLEAKGGQPLLAETRYGLGKTVAFLSDANSRWAADWLRWRGYGRLWAQIVRSAARGAAAPELAWRVARQGGEGLLELTALGPDGTYRNDLWPRVKVLRPESGASVLWLRQSAPGTYRARIALEPNPAAPYRFELLPTPGLSAREIALVGPRTLYYPQSDEFRARPPDVAMLRALSESTGGRFAANADQIFAPGADVGVATRQLWPVLAGTALLLFLLEILVRRAPWRRLDGQPGSIGCDGRARPGPPGTTQNPAP